MESKQRVKTHRLKIEWKYVQKELRMQKPWEIRRNDRNFKEGDIIEFMVLDPDGKPTDITYTREITYLYDTPKHGLKPGYCIMTLTPIYFNNP